MQVKKSVVAVIGVVAVVAAGAVWQFWPRPAAVAPTAGGAPVSVTTTRVKQQTLPITVVANGTVVALQAVEVRAQVNATVKAIHFREGATVKQGDLLFSLDDRTEDAAVKRAEAQVIKSRGDHANAERNLKRQRDLFEQKYISQAGLDTAINQVELLKGQLAVDEASAESARVAKSLTEIRAPFSGRSGAIGVRVGSLVQPSGVALVTISQIDPIAVSFALPERERAFVQQAFARGEVPVSIEVRDTRTGTQAEAKTSALIGKLSFVESTVDTASGTIPMKATLANHGYALWPGMFVSVTVPTRNITDAAVVPVQAVQSGPERKFVYVVAADNIATIQPVEVLQIQSGLAAVTGVAPGTRVVVEGAQNVRNKGAVTEGGQGGIGGKNGKNGKNGEGDRGDKGNKSGKSGEGDGAAGKGSDSQGGAAKSADKPADSAR